MSDQPPAAKAADKAANYLVLARKYRPQTFADLVGQEALVTTLKNAIAAQRIHHAYVLTGIRGVGKTTTARILAKALNCEGGPSVTWAEGDPQCKAIAEGRHVDVLEYDAASNTRIEDVKQLFEGVDYPPVDGRYKVYIIDEVHMLSSKAFNALLKTLEEPPAYVKFIFATTEVDKIPVTVLSRCQRFDLRRIPEQMLFEHYKNICTQENITIADDALHAIARAADGSARDGLSLLDQAIALAGTESISAEGVARMLGQADRSQVYDLLAAALAGDAQTALTRLGDLYTRGYDPFLVLQDLQRTTHLVTRLKVVPGLATATSLTEVERMRGTALAETTSLETLARTWQMLLTAAQEVKLADRPLEALEMALVRICYLAPLSAVDTLLGQNQPTQALNAPATQPVATPAVQATTPTGETPPWEDDAPTAPAPLEEPAAPKAPRPLH